LPWYLSPFLYMKEPYPFNFPSNQSPEYWVPFLDEDEPLHLVHLLVSVPLQTISLS